MPPKKAAAKGAAKPQAVEKIVVPRPPPTPVLVRFPEGSEDPQEAASSRCALLAWRDPDGQYKLETRTYTGDDKDPEQGWEEVTQVQPRPMGGRSDVHLVSGLQSIRTEFRLASTQQEKLDDKYVANWFSAPSDPCVSIIDPPTSPEVEVLPRGDYASLGARLRFGSTNPGATAVSPQADASEQEVGPLLGWPGLGICRAQARWRVLRLVDSDGTAREMGNSASSASDASRLPPGSEDGEKQVGPLVEVGCASSPFDAESGKWSFVLGDMPHGLVVRLEVRVGTAYRWSPWSEESQDVLTEVQPPQPCDEAGASGDVEIVSSTDSSAKIRWQPFVLAEGLKLCEYRVMVCQLPTKEDDRKSPQWDNRTSNLAGIFTVRAGEEPVEYDVNGLMADMFYILRVDARYPYVGTRGWSTPAVTEAPLHTSFALRPPPTAPLVLPAADVEAILQAGQGASSTPAKMPFPENLPWLVLLIESSACGEYRIEYAASAISGLPGEEAPEESNSQDLEWRPATKVVALGMPQVAAANEGWTAMAVLLSPSVKDWRYEAVVCRLRHGMPSSVPPHLATGSVSEPLVPRVAPPAHCCAEMRYSLERQCFGLMVRFYLGSAAPEAVGGDSALAVVSALKKSASALASKQEEDSASMTSGTEAHYPGHRFVNQVQVAVRRIREDEKAEKKSPEPWTLFPVRSLPAPRPRCTSDLHLGVLFHDDQALTTAAPLLWDAGDRHEVWIWAGEGMGIIPGEFYAVRVRVGTAARWSPWVNIPGQTVFAVPAPKPMRVRHKGDQRLECTMTSPTTAVLRFPPFMLSPSVQAVEYVITAVPRFRSADEDDQEGATLEAHGYESEDRFSDGGGDGEGNASNALGEGAAPVQKTVVVRCKPARTDEEVVRLLDERNALQDLRDITASQAQIQLRTLMQQCAEAEMDASSKSQSRWMQVELPGLLPATEYELGVAARYPGIPDAPLSEPLKEVAETPCGASPPVAPAPLPAAQADKAGVGKASREVALELEDRPGYILQCMGVPSQDGGGWYPAPVPTDKRRQSKSLEIPSSGEEATRWWADARAAVEGSGAWFVVPTRSLQDVPSRAGFVSVVAELPGFAVAGNGSSSAAAAKANMDFADSLRFRLCVETREGCHACRWVGSAMEPIASCIAPITGPPLPKRVYTDNSWHVSVAFFAHLAVRPQAPGLVAEVRSQLPADGGFPELLGAEEPAIVVSADDSSIREAADASLEGTEVPIGFGHRRVRWAQLRVQHVGEGSQPSEAGNGSTSPADWFELPEVPIGQCKKQAPQLARSGFTEKVGNLLALEIRGDEAKLSEGGIYRVQVRVGDGYRWSAWSPPSRRFEFGVPEPQPVEGSLEVRTLSASVVQLRWRPFGLPPGISEACYLLHAEPTTPAMALQGVHAVEVEHVLPARPEGDILEADLPNVLPATEYIFSVSARYPRIGPRAWGGTLKSRAQGLDDSVSDWAGPPAPTALPWGGPRPFVLDKGDVPLFQLGDRALLMAFPDTSAAPDGIAYRLEYRHVGILQSGGADVGALVSEDDNLSAAWRTPMEVTQVEHSEALPADGLLSYLAPWKQPARLWRVLLPAIAAAAGRAREDLHFAHLQRVQLRLVAESRGNCPATRWFSAPSPPLCAAMAPPLKAAAVLQVSDTDLTIQVSFDLDRQLAPAVLAAMAAGGGIEQLMGQQSGREKGEEEEETAVPQQLPKGFGHAFATRFQVRSRNSARPPGVQGQENVLERGKRRASLVPWSMWSESPDAGLQVAVGEPAEGEGEYVVRHTTCLMLPEGNQPDHGSWYQVSIRISDGTCWSDWSKPSAPVKVFVAPPKPVHPDTEELSVVRGYGGNNLRLRWSLLRAPANLRLIEYALYVREVLHDRSEICPRQLAALVCGSSARPGAEETGEERETLSTELRDLRQDVNYIFTLAARYPHVGSREFEDALTSSQISLKAACAPLPVPIQVPLPQDRLRRMQLSRYVLVRWSLAGLPPGEAVKDAEYELDSDRRYDLQALAEGGGDNDWIACRNIARMKVDGVLVWIVKDIPGNSLRSRFRLWEKDSGRFGRTSPLMVSFMEPVTKLGAARIVTETSVQIILRAPLDGPHGSHEFACRYQIRYRPDKLESEWVDLPVQMLWHRQNDHLETQDAAVDHLGAVFSGLGSEQSRKTGENKAGSAEGVAGALGVPTLPLAVVKPCGDVVRQHCVVATLREEDGLQLGQGYVFSIRVGDLFRMSEWSPESSPVTLGVPPPQISPDLRSEQAKIYVGDVTSTSFVATWPQFMPAAHASVPIHAEVEYLLVVSPQKPRSKLGRNRPKEEMPPPHSQWLLSSTLKEGTLPEEVGPGELRTVSVWGLTPHTGYELRLGVRYSRLGARGWSEVLTAAVTTAKPDSDGARLARGESVLPPELVAALPPGSFTPRQQAAGGPPPAPQPAEPAATYRSDPAASIRRDGLDAKAFLKLKEPFVPESPRKLPPLDSARQASAERDLAVDLVTAPLPEDVEEWVAAAQADAARLSSGMRRHGLHGPGASPRQPQGRATPQGSPEEGVEPSAEQGPGYPPRPPDYVSFWRRDPMDGRPAMPVMPTSGHPAMQLDLIGRPQAQPAAEGATAPTQAQPLVPRPPNSDRIAGRISRPPEERTVYPRRHLFDT